MKIAPLTVGVLLLMMLSTVFAEAAISPVENYSASNDESVITVDGNRVYVDDVNAYVSATPHTLTADGYVYLNVTSKTYGGEIDFCFGFDSNLAYPKSLEVYDPRNETIQHVLNVTSYLADTDCKVDYNFTSGESSKVVYNGYIWVNRKSSHVDESNQTIGLEWTPVLVQHYDVGYPEAGVFYWNTTETLYWRSIRENWNFDKNAFSFKGMSTWYVAEFAVEKYEEYSLRLWLTVVPTLDDATREFFVAIKPHGETLEQALASNCFYYLDPWYNDGWQYRKSHVINMASGAGTNYQVRVRVHSDSGTDSGENVYLSGKCRSDFGDIRFTGSDGATLLDYWMEGITGSEAVFWVEITEDLDSADRTIYLYYGNSIAATTSNFDGTFIFGDSFDSANLNTNRWPSRDGNPQFWIDPAVHFLEVYDMDADNWWNGKGFHSKSISLPSSWIIESAYGVNAPFTMYHTTDTESEICSALFTVHHTTYDAYDRGIAFGDIADNWAGDMHWYSAAGVGGSEDWSTGEQSTQPPVTKSFLIWKLNGNIHIKVDGTERVNEANGEVANQVCLGIRTYSTYGFGTERFYAFKIRKYISPEPQHGVWGEEEAGGTPPPSSAVSIIWHCAGSSEWFYTAGWPDESNEANEVCGYIYDLYCNYRNYEWVDHYAWGSATESNIYSVTDASNNYDYGTVFTYAHGGHWAINGLIWIPPYQKYDIPVMHYVFYAYWGEYVWDYELYDHTWSGNQKFVFQWTCVQAEEIGWYDYSWYQYWVYYFGTGAVGRAYSWTQQDETVLNFDGYSNPDSTEYCFMGFEWFSPPLSEWATPQCTTTYGDFVKKFYQYALQSNYNIHDALDAASYDIWYADYNWNTFNDTDLYNGYWIWVPGENESWYGYMRVFGNSYNVIEQ